MQWNARGLMTNRHELSKTNKPPEVICIQETLLRNKTKSPKLDGYVILRKDHKENKPKGGLAILVKNGLNYTLKTAPEIPDMEIQSIEINTTTGQSKLSTFIYPHTQT